MKVQRYQADDERAILTGMIVNTRVLSKIAAHLKQDKKPFRSRWCNVVAGWCLEHSAKYQKAPRSSIQMRFRHFADTNQDEDSVQLIEKFLSSLSDDYRALSREINEDYLTDVASRHFNLVKLERLNESLSDIIERRDVDAAREQLNSFHPVELSTSSMVSVFSDKQAVLDALLPNENEVLLQYPGALGEFFGPHLQRDGFISFLAPEKRGKSFWLIDLAWRAAVQNRRRTLLYSVGDMSQRQMMRRLIARTARRPVEAGTCLVPRHLALKNKQSVVRSEEQTYARSISLREIKQALKKIWQKTASKQSLLKLKCTANSTTRVADIRLDIEELKREGWTPDVVVIDYADILAPEMGTAGQDYRHQVNETWKAMRRLSQEEHCLVVTATQADAASYDTDLLRRKNFSEDKRKLSHVTGMVGVNQTEEEKEKGTYRLNWILLREGLYYESRCVTVAGSLAVANPAMRSIW